MRDFADAYSIDSDNDASTQRGGCRGSAGCGIGLFFAAGYGISLKLLAGCGMAKFGGMRDKVFFLGGIRDKPQINYGIRDAKFDVMKYILT